MDERDQRLARIAWCSVLLMSAALLCAPWRGHVDDLDAQMHLVVARNLARDHSWFDLRYLPSFHPVFREHLPFGFWPATAAIRVFGEWAVNPLYAAMMLGAIVFAGEIARRIAGIWAGIAAVALLGACESIWLHGGRLLLEPPLLLFATAAAAAGLRGAWPVAGVLAAVAILIKGPFGLLPLACVALVHWRDMRGAAAVLGACVPLAVFLVADPGGGWRSGYLQAQLLASATGGRLDGVAAWWFPLAVVVRRFWPGLPFLALAAWQARREGRLRELIAVCVLLLAALCVPHRKWGNHTYVSFPLLAATAGVAAAGLLVRVRLGVRAAIAMGLAAVAATFCLSGLGARVLRPPCPYSTGLRSALQTTPAGSRILVVTGDPVDATALAAERDLLPERLTALPDSSGVAVAVVDASTLVPESWAVVASAGSRRVLRRR